MTERGVDHGEIIALGYAIMFVLSEARRREGGRERGREQVNAPG